MSGESNVGQIDITGKVIDWYIQDFFSLPQDIDFVISSPMFKFRNEEWKLIVWPNGWNCSSTVGWFGFRLYKEGLSVLEDRLLNVRISVIGTQGVFRSSKAELDSRTDETTSFSVDRFIRRDEVDSQREDMAPGGDLRISCKVTLDDDDTVEACETDASTQTEGKSDLDTLSQNLKDLFLGGEDCDLTIRVQDREFRVHRAILRARSPVFAAMLTHDMVEKRSGTISVDDIDPEVFNDFLLFVYSGRMEGLTEDTNACDLFYTADKYQLPALKQHCIELQTKSLSIETVCDVICLATKHHEADLLEQAISFFVANAEHILVTVKWQQFLKDNPTEANELYIRTLKMMKTT